jgi:HrpA-like RNA helicase
MDDLIQSMESTQVLLIEAETGTGKSTQYAPQFIVLTPKRFPQALIEKLGAKLNAQNRIIGFTQPRRLTTKQLTARIQSEMGLKGGEIAYKIRYDNTTTSKTILKLMTDGMLVAEMIGDPHLSKYGIIILDEIHVRNKNTDIILAKLKSEVLQPCLCFL